MKHHTLSTYRIIGQIISASATNDALEPQLKSYQQWEQLVYHGSTHLLLPTIYKNLKDRQLLHLLPDDLLLYLEDIHQINHNRNLQLLKQIKQLHQWFFEAHINHVFLKGATFLIKGAHNNRLERMVGDIDILIAPEQLNTAFEILQQRGYDKNIGFNYQVKNYRHLDRQISKDGLAAVELHDDLLRHPKQNLINAKTMLDTAIWCNELPIPNQYFMSLHSIMAWQVNDLGYYYNNISLKTLYDTSILQVPKQTELISALQSHKYGRHFLGWAKAFSVDYSAVKLTFWQQLKAYNLELKLQFSLYNQLIYTLKSVWCYIVHRVALWITNPSYRAHIIKNKFNRH